MSMYFPAQPRQKSTSERFADAFGGAAQAAATQIPQYFMQKKQEAEQRQMMSEENEAFKRMGVDVEGIHSPEMRKLAVAESLRGGRESQKLKQQQQEKMVPLQAGLQTISRMRELGNTGHLGVGTSVQGFLNPAASKASGEYEQLGKSLISLASTIPIRNKAEFETLSNQLFDPSIRDSKRAGILDAMERIIRQNMGEIGGGEEYERPSDQKQNKTPRYSHNGNVLMRNPDGTTGQVSPDKVELALSKGYTLQ